MRWSCSAFDDFDSHSLLSTGDFGGGGRWGGGPIYGLYIYMPWDKVWFFEVLGFKHGIVLILPLSAMRNRRGP